MLIWVCDGYEKNQKKNFSAEFVNFRSFPAEFPKKKCLIFYVTNFADVFCKLWWCVWPIISWLRPYFLGGRKVPFYTSKNLPTNENTKDVAIFAGRKKYLWLGDLGRKRKIFPPSSLFHGSRRRCLLNAVMRCPPFFTVASMDLSSLWDFDLFSMIIVARWRKSVLSPTSSFLDFVGDARRWSGLGSSVLVSIRRGPSKMSLARAQVE